MRSFIDLRLRSSLLLSNFRVRLERDLKFFRAKNGNLAFEVRFGLNSKLRPDNNFVSLFDRMIQSFRDIIFLLICVSVLGSILKLRFFIRDLVAVNLCVSTVNKSKSSVAIVSKAAFISFLVVSVISSMRSSVV